MASQLLKSDDTVDGNAVLEEDDRRKHLNLELADEEWALFGINADKSCLQVCPTDFVKMHVYNLASLEILVEKGANDVVCVGNCGQELLLGDLGVRTMAQRLICLIFGVLLAGGRDSLSCHVAKHALFLLIQLEVGVFLCLGAFSLLSTFVGLVETEGLNFGLLRGHHFLLHHRGLILDGLLEDHVSEKVTCQLIVCFHVYF